MEGENHINRKWRSYFIFFSEVPVSNGVYDIDEYQFLIETLPDLNQLGIDTRLKLLSITFSYNDSQSIEDAYLKSINGTELFLNRISLIGYCETRIQRHLVTSIDMCDVGEKFEVLSSAIIHNRRFKYEIQPADFLELKTRKEPYIEIALSFLQKALSSHSLEERIMMLAACLEKLGAEESNEYGQIKCTRCGHVEPTNAKATKKYSRILLQDKGAKTKDILNFLERDRNKIAHGGGNRSVQFYSDLKESILKIQSLIVEIVADRLKANFVNSTTSILDLPFVVYQYEKSVDGFIKSGDVRFSSKAGVSMVSNVSQRARDNITLEVGVAFNQTNPIIHKSFQEAFFPK